jgi:hypothetical protein
MLENNNEVNREIYFLHISHRIIIGLFIIPVRMYNLQGKG